MRLTRLIEEKGGSKVLKGGPATKSKHIITNIYIYIYIFGHRAGDLGPHLGLSLTSSNKASILFK